MSTPDVARPTTDTAVFPSRALKPVPSFIFTVPHGWVLDESPDAIAVVRPPEPLDGFWVNVLVSTDRVARTVDLEQAAAVTLKRLQRDQPDAEVRLSKVAKFGRRIVFLRAVEVTSPKDGRKLAQIQAMFFAPTDGPGKTHDFFQILGTCPLPALDTIGPEVIGVVSSFRFV